MADRVDDERLVGADRVLAVFTALAEHPTGITLDEMAHRIGSSKSTVHRALATLRRAKLAMQLGRGLYVLGDEFFRLAFLNYQERPEGMLAKPVLEELVRRFGETVHYAVLDGPEVVYRAKLDPPRGALRLTSVVGGRNPAQFTAVGKLLLSYAVKDETELVERLGTTTFGQRTPHSLRDVSALWDEVQRIRVLGYAVDDQESELGVNCVAVPVSLDKRLPPIGAVSVSALAFRLPLDQLVERVGEVREVVERLWGSEGEDNSPHELRDPA